MEDGRVTFEGDAEAIARANVFLRTAERVLLKAGSFTAVTFDELFEKTRAIPWERYIPRDGKCWVTKASSIKSKLFSPSDIQRIMKKGHCETSPGGLRSGAAASFGDRKRIPAACDFFFKDQVTVGIDTSGDSLHKRGYRTLTSKAPITETLAAALILLTPWKKDRILVDPFCGSGTFPIEAAMIAANIAPGMNRSFLAEGLGKTWFRESTGTMRWTRRWRLWTTASRWISRAMTQTEILSGRPGRTQPEPAWIT